MRTIELAKKQTVSAPGGSATLRLTGWKPSVANCTGSNSGNF